MIAVVAKTLSRNADVAEQLELLADLLEIEGEASFRVIAYRRAATRVRETGTPGRPAGARRHGEGAARDRRDDPGQDRPDRRTPARSRRSRSAARRSRRRWSSSCASRASARRRCARSGRSSGVTTLAELKEAARAAAAADAARPRREDRGEHPQVGRRARRRRPGPPRTLLGQALPALLAVVEVLREHPAADRVSEAGSARRRKETVRDLDIIATASDPKALTEYFTKLTWVSEVVGEGPDEGDGRLARGLPLRPARRPARELRQPAAALHRLEGAQPRAARGRAAPRPLGLRVRDHRGRERRGLHGRERGGGLRAARLRSTSRPSCARTRASSRRRGRASCRSWSSRAQLRGDLHTHSHWSADGKNTLEEMVAAAKARGYAYYAITDHSHYLREGRMEAAGEGDRQAGRAGRAAQAAEGRRGEHQGRRHARRARRGARRARLGGRVDPHRLRPLADRADHGDDGEPARAT